MKLWNVATRREVASLKLGFYVGYITFSPDGQTLAAWGGERLTPSVARAAGRIVK